jgi:L-ribulose-5-phosphate 3-epimerase
MTPGITQLVLPLPTIDFLSAARNAGYQTAELAMLREGDLTLDTSQADLRAYADHADKIGIELVSMCQLQCTGNLLTSGDQQKISLDQTIAGLKAAKSMGITCTLHTLGRLDPDLYYDDAYNNAVQSLQTLAPVCEQLGVDIALEFVWNGFLFSPMEYKRLLDDVASPRIGFYHDPGNMAVFQYPHHWVRILGNHIKMVHLKDWKGGPLNGQWTALLEGEIDFVVHNKELRAAGYDGPMISEVDTDLATIEATCKAIQKIITM